MAVGAAGDVQGGHHAEAGIEARQAALDIAQFVAVSGSALGTGVGPDLEKIVMPDVRVVLFPCCGQIEPTFFVHLAAITVVRAVKPLIGLALMPQHAADAMGELGRDHAPLEIAVDRAFLVG